MIANSCLLQCRCKIQFDVFISDPTQLKQPLMPIITRRQYCRQYWRVVCWFVDVGGIVNTSKLADGKLFSTANMDSAMLDVIRTSHIISRCDILCLVTAWRLLF